MYALFPCLVLHCSKCGLIIRTAQPEAGEVTPMFPALNHVLYESTYQGQTCVITDTNKKIIYWGDMFPKKTKLEKVCVCVYK